MQSTYEDIYALVEPELQSVIDNIAALAGEESLRGDDAMAGRLEHVLSSPGKRMRPTITLLASRLWGARSDLDVTMATGVELLHIATLIHDDTVDAADTRRGRATASSLWGRNVAVLLGDYVFAAAARFVCDTNSVRLVRRFAETIMELSRGELNELMDGRDGGVLRAAYLQRIYDKTASLFTTAAESGAVLGGGPEAEIQRVRDYGYNLGMAYQVLDDIMDYESTEAEMGKPAGNDLKEGVLTLPAIMLIERSPDTNAVLRWFGSLTRNGDGQDGRSAALLAEALQEVRAAGVIQEAKQVARDYLDAARSSLGELPEGADRAALERLADLTEGRRT